MLSIKVFSSASNAKEYYSHEDYYGTEAKGEWYGEGAKEFGLEGEFTAKDSLNFKDILNGILPDGKKLGKIGKNGEISHRPGIDLTFSSPKSFSIQMHVFASKEEKEKLEQARMSALHNTLKYIEQSGLIYTRKGKSGIIQEEVSKLTFALFTHTTNRNLEPQDHVHCLLANVAKCEDGKYRSIVWDKLLENNKFIGQIFRNELAIETAKLGYEIVTKLLPDGSSSFELESIPQPLIDAFSTRRQEIVALYEKFNVKTKEGRDRIVINSRKAKQTVKKESLESAWREVVKSTYLENEHNKAKAMTVTGALEKIRDFLTDKFSITYKTQPQSISKLTSDDLAKLCLDDTSHHDSVFSRHNLSRKALKYAIGKYRIGDIEASINKLIDKKEIIVGKDNLLTSNELLEKEKSILKIAKQGINKHVAIIDKSNFKNRFALHEKYTARKYPLNQEQIKAIKHVLTSCDKITAIQGLPGVGKSTVLDVVRQMSQRKVIDLLGAAPTASAAKTLQDSAGINSSTLHSFIGKYKGYLENRGTKEGLLKTQDELSKTIVFIDEASLISTRMMHNLLKLSEILKFRVVLIGDTKQLSAVEAGKPFEQLLTIVKSAKLTTILRQNDSIDKEAVKAAAGNRLLDTFHIHKRNIKEVGDQLVPQAVAEYMSLTGLERENTLLISPTRIHRDEINKLIVSQLQKEDRLTGQIYEQNILKQKDVTKADHNFAKCYEPGNVVKFHINYHSLGIKKDDYLEVKSINNTTNTIIFKKGFKNIEFRLKTHIDYESKLEIFKKETIELQAGVKLRITKNERNFTNSETLTVTSINKNQIAVKLEDGTKRTVSPDQLRHIDYGYCSTVHSAQGKTTDRLIAAISSHHKLNNQKAWLVAISRHKQNISIYMDYKEEVQNQIIKNSGEVKSALDLKEQRFSVLEMKKNSN